MNILVVEDHPITRLGVRQLLQGRWPEIAIVERERADDAVALLAQQAFDAIILDLNLPGVVGLEGLIRVRGAAPATPVLVLSGHAESGYAIRVLREGAFGYLSKDRAPDELIAALERILLGMRYITASLAGELAQHLVSPAPGLVSQREPHEDLSPQEHRVMLQLVQGVAVSEIASRMQLSPKTISTYRSRILEKLGLAGNVELVKYCMARGLASRV